MAKWVCKVCGYVHEGDTPPERCPQCGAPADKFEKMDENKKTWAPLMRQIWESGLNSFVWSIISPKIR